MALDQGEYGGSQAAIAEHGGALFCRILIPRLCRYRAWTAAMIARSSCARTVLLLASVLFGSSSVQAKKTENKPPIEPAKFESVDMTTLTSGEIAIPVTLSNRPTTELFEIDTGNGYTAITWETAEELKVKTKYTPYGGAYVNNVAINQYAKLDSIGVGRLQSDGKWVALVVRNEMVPPTIAGLVGTDILKNYDVEFDFYNGKVNFFGHNKCPSAVYWTKGNFADVPMKLDAGWHIVVD